MGRGNSQNLLRKIGAWKGKEDGKGGEMKRKEEGNRMVKIVEGLRGSTSKERDTMFEGVIMAGFFILYQQEGKNLNYSQR